MCGRYGVPEERAIEIDAQRRNEPVQLYLDGFKPRFNLAPTQQAPVMLREDQGLAVRMMRWGIIGTKGMHPNTMAESLEKWGSYFNGFGRALVPAGFFFEWAMIGGKKRAFCIRPTEPDALWWFAGVTKEHALKDRNVTSFNIVTVPSNGDLEELHHRAPAILTFEAQQAWLDPKASRSELFSLLRPVPAGSMDVFEVSSAVGAVSNEGPDLIKPIGKREAPEY